MPTLFLGVVAAMLVLLSVRLAAANGRFPQSNQIVFSFEDPNLIVARTTYAILVSHDGGRSWYFLCEDALGIGNTAQDPELALTASDTLVVGSSSGLQISTDLGCNWRCVEGLLAQRSVADVVVRPDAPHSVLALTAALQPSDAGPAYVSQVFESPDDGATWSALGAPIDPKWVVETIDVAKTDPGRIYVSAWRGYDASRTAALFVSTDKGTTWTERDVPGFDGTAEDRIWIGAVDPTQADRVYLRSNAQLEGGRSRLYMSADAGQSFTELESFDVDATKPSYQEGEFPGFTLSPDGLRIYLGNSQGGMFVADRSRMTFTETSPIDIHCLASRALPGGGSETWACADVDTSAAHGVPFVIGSTEDDGRTFTAKLSDNSALASAVACAPNPGGPLGCGAAFNGSECGNVYDFWCGQQAPDLCGAGAASPAPHGDANGTRRSSSCGCSIVGGDRAAGLFAACALAAVALARLRR